MTINVILNLLAALALLGALYAQQRRHASFSVRVFTGMGLGVLLGAALQALYGASAAELKTTGDYLDIVGSGYVKLLQMIVMPLIMVSIISAIIKLKGINSLGKISALTIVLLMLTTLIAAGLGILMAKLFQLSAVGLTASAADVARGVYLQGKVETAQAISLPSMLLSFIPANPFLDMTGGRKTSTIAVVIFSVFIGIAATGIHDKKPDVFAAFERFIQVAHAIVMRIVTLVLRLTPYGVFALMAQVVSTSSYTDILHLIDFVLASYSALILMFCVHLALVAGAGLNPARYVRKILPVLTFAFTSRSSAGAIPMSVQTQTLRLGTSEGIANFAASFGATIGQNGCAGIYPAMLAVMIAPTVGIDPFTLAFIAPLLAIITIGSVGVAGVGGGATFAALIVLSSMNLPVALAGLLISIEPLIDMGRTALNVSGSIAAGTVTSRVLGETDLAVFNGDAELPVDSDRKAA
ncbi:L-cystine transporter [Duganella violaceipulchra]|uniref:Cation:dicarboxylase symporter family transporter n=1 Tax=Duganella violaceipulchra TaxID=2849652 RepID=A0AA41L6V1_9BURK|nr:cation:dicarboxylase symporter family transporter [Duganella violaceicalia]MBV6325659.1 cation:dicarboxylase symporter family transporter [Duganella violaceicalia]MCP2009836.1 L-cystine uptake protein TcyP (sodium:dicarboxylate symporter family) [Duganella violaceicalia]